MTLIHPQSIVVLDFGGQYSHLIANRIRRLNAFSEIRDPETPAEELKDAAGIILSGGPQSVYDKSSPQADPKIFELGIPILGICYGHQWMAQTLGGKVQEGEKKEYGFTEIQLNEHPGQLLDDLKKEFTVWMSHGDEVGELPKGFHTTATSSDSTIAAMEDAQRKFFGIQFHPEVTHTEYGMEILQHFRDLCMPANWKLEDIIAHMKEEILETVGNRNVFILASGGVDSTVAFTLLNEVLGTDRVYGLLIDHGLMRKNEIHEITDIFANYGYTNLHVEDASTLFLSRLEGKTDPEEKRRIIGKAFLDVQSEVASRLKLDGPNWLLGQGTIYPDTIETGGTKHADQIKTHHNRVPEVEKMIEEGRVIEPLKELYKDEVRMIGERLGLPRSLVWRHPFPGPGLGVRILCSNIPNTISEKEKERINVSSSLYSFGVLPILTVGVQGDKRSYRHPLTIFFEKTPLNVQPLRGLATSIPNEYSDINRVIFCTSHKEKPQITFTPTTITQDVVDILREADAIVTEYMRSSGLYDDIWQFPVVLLPIGSKDGQRSIVLRPVESAEAMTANAYALPPEFINEITEELLTIKGIDMVFYDVTNKPPATIEWE